MSTPPLIWLRQEPGTRRAAHSRAEIARVAVEIADAEGFHAVSMRRVARALGAGTMTLYHYVRNKDELVTLMHDWVMGEVLVPDGELPQDWREAISAVARRSREAFRRHPWTLDRISEPALGPNGVRHFEQSLAAVAGSGLPAEQRIHLLSLVDEYVFGFSVRESMSWGADTAADAPWPRETVEFFQRELDSGGYPHISALFEEADAAEGAREVMRLIGDPSRFERGLAQLLDGVYASSRA